MVAQAYLALSPAQYALAKAFVRTFPRQYADRTAIGQAHVHPQFDQLEIVCANLLGGRHTDLFREVNQFLPVLAMQRIRPDRDGRMPEQDAFLNAGFDA